MGSDILSLGTTPLEIARGQSGIICSLMDLLRSDRTTTSPYQVAAAMQAYAGLRKWAAPLEREGPYSATGLAGSARDGFIDRNRAAASGVRGSGIPIFILNRMRRLLRSWLPPVAIPLPTLGPGAVFEKYSYFYKRVAYPSNVACYWSWRREHEELRSLRSGSPPDRHRFLHSVDDIRAYVADTTDRVCRLCDVPKTWKARRLITVEPYVLTCLQQAVRSYILHSIRRGPLGRLPYWKNFEADAQSIQRHRAMQGSRTGRWATLDLSAASDGIDVETFLMVFPDHISDLVMSVRSESFIANNGRHDLHILGGMGNATTFMVESLFFQALMVAVSYFTDQPLSWDEVTVFGDDIIVPTSIMRYLPQDGFGRAFQLNADKSFWTGRFRESCGVYAFQGIDVTPVNIRGPYPGASGISSLCQLWHTLRGRQLNGSHPLSFIADAMLSVIPWGAFLPNFEVENSASRCIHDTRFATVAPRRRYNKDLQRY